MPTLLRSLFGGPAAPRVLENHEPIREELFSIERLEEHAASLALAQKVEQKPTKGRSLAGRLAENGATLLASYKDTVKAIDDGRAITPAAEWLVDNYHLVEKQIRQLDLDLPPGYYRQLPKLATGPFLGYPRVFGLAWAFVAHTDSHFDSDILLRYVRAYQAVQPLTIGELWAVSITLRIVLIENLGRLADQIVQNRAARVEADGIADRLLAVGAEPAEPVAAVFAHYTSGALPESFAVQLAHRLRDQDPKITPALAWLDRRLELQQTTADQAVREVHRRQGASNVTVRNIITSLKLISDLDWKDLFERTCLVDEALADGGAYHEMDFATRNLYRSAVEELSRGSDHSELDVARKAAAAARSRPAVGDGNRDARTRDAGYFLLAGGRSAFEKTLDFRVPLRAWPARMNRACGIAGYATANTLVTLVLLASPLLAMAYAGLPIPSIVVLALLGLVPAIDLAVALVNRAVPLGFAATLLPALELRGGVPSRLRTLVATPTMLTTLEAIEEQIERLEVHHLASPEGDLHFAILSDWVDAETEHAADDNALLSVAADGIARLNQRYGPAPGGPRFMLLHRRRVWNSSEQKWIGWERKRGKLHELNRFLRGAPDTTFMAIDGSPPPSPTDVRYVITLDADTRLPRDTVRRLIGKMAHPLNRPRFDQASGRIVEGYAILQPRVTPSLPIGREGSLFQRIFSSLSGIDPYASAVSDVYQDLFGEGSYAGKGIYDVDAFETALSGRVPDSTLLSHDLFEGVFARAGLASDIEVIEEYPARYDVGALRHHRWARGDWQLLPWILGHGPALAAAPGGRAKIPAIGRWKMADNLRRTLSAPAAVAALLAGWTAPFRAALVWTVFIVSTIIVPTLIPVAAAIPPRGPAVTIVSHMRALVGDLRLALTLSALILTFLAHQAWLMADAVIRTIWRVYVSRRHLLEWVPAAQAASGARLDISGFYRRMFGAVVIAALAMILASIFGRGTLGLASLFATLWLTSPAVARWVSLSPAVSASDLSISGADTRVLRLTARRTWRFFETFVTPADNHLPPDNFQEDPASVVAHRTSPTNLGLYLLSLASARDFGWIGTAEAATRLEATLDTMDRMERFRGHFYNWYGTQDLRPLDPKYVSSVDSGNLAGHLIALANSCRAWRVHALDADRILSGVADAIDIAHEEAERVRDGRKTQTVTFEQLDGSLSALAVCIRKEGIDEGGLAERLSALSQQAATMVDMANAFGVERGDDACTDLIYWARAGQDTIKMLRRDVDRMEDASVALDARLAALESRARSLALAMEFSFMLDHERGLLSIGYLAAEGALDHNCYDLLASEARLASFFAIAKGDVPARHWFRLGRAATPVAHGAAMISWSGSMFEYLMPSLVMRAPLGSLLEQTNRLVVRRQIDYAAAKNIPWGISESAYNARDLEFTYQYSNFGVPSLGLKRGLGENLVVAPYATALATMVDPRAAAANLLRLTDAGACGRYGFYEALDYTPIRVPEGAKVAVVRAYMAHHQGMTIVAIADALMCGAMRARFHAEPIVQATELLLQERMPRDVSISRPWAAEVKSGARSRGVEPSTSRRYLSPNQTTPATHLLSNGRYSTMLTSAGSGYSRWGDIALTRWREDTTSDDSGSYIFLRDIQSGDVWSAGFQPSGAEPDAYCVAFSEDRAEFTRRDGSLTTGMDVLVSPEIDAEVRRVTISNRSSRAREMEITSYAELVLAPQVNDVLHPAFSKLFVETEYLPGAGVILATRRKRTPDEPEIWAAHLAILDGEALGGPEIETDRARFLGRGHGVRNPISVIDGRPLSGTTGAVLDPVFALRQRVRIAPGATAHISFWTLAASSRHALLESVDKHRDATAYERTTTLAWTQAQVQLHHLGVTASEAALFQRLAGHAIYAAPLLRASSDAIRKGGGPQSGLWAQSISGDLPIVLVRVSDSENLDVVRELLQAHEYWRMKQFAVDLVILNERQSSYVQDLQIAIETLVRASQSRPPAVSAATAGRVFALRSDLVPAETRALLNAVSRIVIVAERGSLFDQLERIADSAAPLTPVARRATAAPELFASMQTPPLEFFNGLGGFADDGKEYVTILGPGQLTPAPWINVVANPGFGFQAATEGSGYTWSVNSRENQLTPWSNDPVENRSGETFYLRDDDTGEVWGPTALPIRVENATYVARHGRGYCQFQHESHGIAVDLLQFVPIRDPVKISRLVLRNRSGHARRISATAYVEWVLGPSRASSIAYVTTELDDKTGAIFARNPWRAELGSRVAFADLRGRQTDWTGDRGEFVGRNRNLSNPAAVFSGLPLSNKVGAGRDPCAAMRTTIVLEPGAVMELVFFLGETANADEARDLVTRYRATDLDAVRDALRDQWEGFLGAVQVETPDRAMDIMLNGWLLYQTLACRVWARSAFYQASGAYGFRDQLQDGMALAAVCPALTREHLLRSAARQFVEGDVQHWWLPQSGRGVRSSISDDRAWLAYAVNHYVDVTGDKAVFDEVVPFLEGRALEPGEHDSFFEPRISEKAASLFEHCALALDRSLDVGGHGLPLIAGGDWNDGMNRVGDRGMGESVWLGWLLYATLMQFAPIAEARKEAGRARSWRTAAAALQASLEREAWDGEWYLRGFYDDGTSLGSASSEECRIDSIAQSWAVLSGASAPERATCAMAAAARELIRPDVGLALLFTPPFDRSALDPGYIKGYPPGVRENGGQYTHAAIWSTMAFAELLQGDAAAALFAMLNPINHARTRADVHRYKVEPYVIAADVYAEPRHVGRGGWTWYTGAAGWMQRAGVESILGVRFRGGVLHLDPCIPAGWSGYEVAVRYKSTRYEIAVESSSEQDRASGSASLDGVAIDGRPWQAPLVDDGQVHHITVRLGRLKDELKTRDR